MCPVRQTSNKVSKKALTSWGGASVAMITRANHGRSARRRRETKARSCSSQVAARLERCSQLTDKPRTREFLADSCGLQLAGLQPS